MALLFVHAINPHGFAWLRRVTEEGCDLNRNFIDFAKPLPQNPGYDEIAELVLPPVLSGPAFDATLETIAAYKAKHGDRAWQSAFSQGQYKHPHGMFYGGTGPSWARRTLETIIDEYDLPARRAVGVIDYHTGLGPFGYGEPICGNPPGSAGLATAVRWYGESLTSPDLGTSSSVPKTGLWKKCGCLATRPFTGARVRHLSAGDRPHDSARRPRCIAHRRLSDSGPSASLRDQAPLYPETPTGRDVLAQPPGDPPGACRLPRLRPAPRVPLSAFAPRNQAE